MLYYLILPVLYFFAYMPTGVLYKLADILAFVLYRIIGYRKKVVMTNLRNSFPEKTEAELKQIAKESYAHLADRVIENIKCFTISKEEINERIKILNPEVLEHYYQQGRHVIIMVGHIASWEFGGYKLSVDTKFKQYGIVSLVSNKRFNALIQRTRGKMGMHLVPMKDSKEFFNAPLKETSMIIFISDQSPSNPQKAYWTNFLHQDTGFFTGAERYAKLHNCVVIYPNFYQTTQGHFEAKLEVLTENAPAEKDFAITEKFVRRLEQQILSAPSDWLWSHKRWKRKRPENI